MEKVVSLGDGSSVVISTDFDILSKSTLVLIDDAEGKRIVRLEGGEDIPNVLGVVITVTSPF